MSLNAFFSFCLYFIHKLVAPSILFYCSNFHSINFELILFYFFNLHYQQILKRYNSLFVSIFIFQDFILVKLLSELIIHGRGDPLCIYPILPKLSWVTELHCRFNRLLCFYVKLIQNLTYLSLNHQYLLIKKYEKKY
jgi:hypothetical protein